MKAISLWNPWAAAVAYGLKRFETRSWPTSYRGPLAIHAAKTEDYVHLLPELLREAGIEGAFPHLPMEFGAVIATCELVDCVPAAAIGGSLNKKELAFGDFTPGRFAWRLENVARFSRGIRVRGAQGLFEVDLSTTPATRPQAARQVQASLFAEPNRQTEPE